MSLRWFHLFFIMISAALAAFVAVWAVGQYQAAHDTSYLLAGIIAVAGAVGLAFYAAMFIRKTKNL